MSLVTERSVGASGKANAQAVGSSEKVFWILVTLLAAAGMLVSYAIMREPMFRVQLVEVVDLPPDSPVDVEWVSQAAGVREGVDSLFVVDLSLIESRILQHPWIRSVVLTKRFPQTLTVSVQLRAPVALLQGTKGELSYVDAEGKVFGRFLLGRGSDLPVLAGMTAQDSVRLREALGVLRNWEGSRGTSVPGSFPLPAIDQLSWGPEHGYRAVVTETNARALKGMTPRQRIVVELGPWLESEFGSQAGRLHSVFRYIRERSLSVRQIWADAGKKIVVKTNGGS